MMHVLQVVMMVVTFHSVSCAACTYKPLSSSFDQNGQSICNKTNYYIRGIERSEDTLRASDKQFPTQTQCDANMKCDYRLKLMFGDWRLIAKEVKYGESVTEELQPDTVDSGTTYNKEDNPATESFEVTRDVEETISHTVSDGWAKSHDLDLPIGFNVPMYGGASFGYRINTNESLSNSNTTSTTKTRTLKKKTTKTLQGHSAAKYRVIVRKIKTTIPYTAIITAHFSTEFSGFLRHGGGYGSPTTNYHHQHQGSEDSPLFTYTFGGPSTPFYAALQSESESDSQPWLWNEMFQKYPSVRGIIGKLTNEKQYQFTLNGTLEHIGGRNMEVIWETVQMNRR